MTIFLRPSSSHRWWNCADSVFVDLAAGDMLDRETDAAREGTCAAWVAECVLEGDAGTAEDLLGRVHKNGWEVDEDMVRHVQPYIELCQTRHNGVAEETLSVDWPGQNDDVAVTLGGTADHKGWADDLLTKRHVTDLKFGYGIVDPFENRQLLCYAYLDYAKMVRDGIAPPQMYILSIYQPRALHKDGIYRKWVVSLDEIMPYFKQINDLVRQIMLGGSRAGSWCMHCPRAARCATLTQSVYAMWEPLSGRAFLNPTGQQLADELDMLDRFRHLYDARKAAVSAEVESRVAARKHVPGWGMVDKIGKAAWKHEPEVIEMMTGVDPYEQKTVTPAELKRRGADKDLVDELTYRPKVGRKLDRVTQQDIARAFGELPK